MSENLAQALEERHQRRLDTLEALIDETSLYAVLADLESICYDKADHIRTNWQDGRLAKSWDRVGRRIGGAVLKASQENLT